MRIKQIILGAAFGAVAVFGASQSLAQTTFNATYYTVGSSTPDFNGPPCGEQDCGQVYTNNAAGEVLGALGPNGLPVYNTSFGGEALHDLSLTTGELQWWSGTPSASGTVNAPLNFNAFFPPDGTGPNDLNGFLTATFTGSLDLAPGGAIVTFNMSSDDDTFLAVDGNIIAQDGGIHPLGAGTSVTQYLSGGDHSVEIFYADRHIVGAQLDFSESIAAVPEPATWAMMLAGFGGMGAALRSRRKRASATA